VLASSAEVYGAVPESDQPIGEDAPLRPLSPYATSKLEAEAAAHASSVEAVIARPFPHIGPGQDERFAIASFARQIASIERGDAPPVLRVGNLEARRDLSDVRCVADAYLSLLGSPHASGTYNISTGRAERIGDVLDALLRLSDQEIEIAEDPDRLRPADIPLLCGDPGRIAHDLGWQADRPLEQTLLDTLTFFRERLA
jgi:GDP-4-dehydro-6-deoxy-D-mannose reductase